MSYCRDIGTPNNISKKIFHIVYNHENQSVDLLKGKELANLLSSVDQNLINKIITSANAHPLGSIKDWVADAKELKNNKKLEVSLDMELIEEEDYGLLKMAEANGLTVNEMIRKILKEKKRWSVLFDMKIGKMIKWKPLGVLKNGVLTGKL